MATKTLTVPATITITNNGTADVGFRYFRVNLIEVLKAGDQVVLTANTSEECAYYSALNDSTIGLAIVVTPKVA